MRGTVVVIAGVLMVLSSAAHSLLGWRMMSAELAKAGVGESLAGALAAGWIFGGVSMLAFGIITVNFGIRLRKGDRAGSGAVRVIAAAYVLFGIGAFVKLNFNTHFLLFVLTGVLAGAPLFGMKRQ